MLHSVTQQALQCAKRDREARGAVEILQMNMQVRLDHEVTLAIALTAVIIGWIAYLSVTKIDVERSAVTPRASEFSA